MYIYIYSKTSSIKFKGSNFIMDFLIEEKKRKKETEKSSPNLFIENAKIAMKLTFHIHKLQTSINH